MKRRTFLKSLVGLALSSGAACAGSALYARRVETTWLDIVHLQLPIKNLAPGLEGLKIVQLSDLHLYPHTQLEYVQDVIAAARQLQPDLVALTGDYVLADAEAIFDLAPALTAINPRYGFFAVLGNHDLWTNERIVQRGLEKAGIRLLKNEGLSLRLGRDLLYIAGVDDGWSGRPDLALAMALHPGHAPTLLLAHEPDLADRFARDERISIQLSGHTHGGQVRLPGYGALVLPRLGRKYDLGLYQVGSMWLYTNRGVGVIGPPIRLNCRPELTEIMLIDASSGKINRQDG